MVLKLTLVVVVTITSFISYFYFFFQFPALRDFPVVNLPLIILEVILTTGGCWQVFKQRGGILGKCLVSLGILVVLAVGGFFNFYVFSMSYQLPESAQAVAAAPGFTLLGHDGQNLSLSDYRSKKVELVFYRGNL